MGKSLVDVLTEYGGVEVAALELYADVFKFDDDEIQTSTDVSTKKGNPIGFSMDWVRDSEGKLVIESVTKVNKKTGHSYIKQFAKTKNKKIDVLFSDTFSKKLKKMQDKEFAIIGGCTYFGHVRKQEYASKLYALIFDLDGINVKTLQHFLFGSTTPADLYPLPNYICLSGHGAHLYYLLDVPIRLFPKTKIELNKFKYALTDLLWNNNTSTLADRQYQGIYQGYRVVGARTKKGSSIDRVRAFKFHPHPYDITTLSNYLPDDKQIDIDELWNTENRISLDEAKKLYPEWYAKIFNEDGTRKPVEPTEKKGFGKKAIWDIAGKVHGDNPYALYDWWKKQMWRGLKYHRRYFNLMCLAIYAVKCGVDFEDLEADAYELLPYLQSLSEEDVFSANDIDAALEAYDTQYCTFPIWAIEKVSGVEIKRNKRNRPDVPTGDRQQMHMQDMVNEKRMRKERGLLRNPDGRPPKKDLVLNYISEHPACTVKEIAENLGVSLPTVYKYYSNEGIKEKIANYIRENPNYTKLGISKDLGISRTTVTKYINMLNLTDFSTKNDD